MKLLLLIITASVLSIAVSAKLTAHKGSYEFNSASLQSTKKEHVIYQLCLKSAPEFFTATARPSNTFLPHKFNLTVLQIMKPNAVVKLERTDGPTGWENINITVDWIIALGVDNGMVSDGQFIWMPDPRWFSLSKLNAEQQCTTAGGQLLDVVNQKMFEEVSNFMKATYKANDYVDMWIGITYNATSGLLTQTNGEPAGFPVSSVPWFRGFPQLKSEKTGMVFLWSKLANVITGLYNAVPSQKLGTSSLLCSYNLNQ